MKLLGISPIKLKTHDVEEINEQLAVCKKCKLQFTKISLALWMAFKHIDRLTFWTKHNISCTDYIIKSIIE